MTDLQSLGSIGEFVGAIGVVISLVYLAQQMRQNTISVRAASFNSMVHNSIGLLEHSFRDSEFAAFVSRAERDPDALSPEESLRWDAYMTAVYRHFGNLVYQHRVGALDPLMWEAYQATLKDHLRTPAWASWYEEERARIQHGADAAGRRGSHGARGGERLGVVEGNVPLSRPTPALLAFT